MGHRPPEECVQVVRLSIRRQATTDLRLEPWGMPLRLPAGESFEIVFQGPTGASPEVDVEGDRMTVYGWPGSVIVVIHDGTLIYESDVPVPAMPPGLTIRRLVRWMTGGA